MATPGSKPSVLFLCTNNSARSQIAEGFLKSFYGDRFDAFSAGTIPTKVQPLAIKVMAELGIDISIQRPKSILEFDDKEFDIVITLCDPARGSCPIAHGKKVIHVPFMDPATVTGDEAQRILAFREVRDSILQWVRKEFAPR